MEQGALKVEDGSAQADQAGKALAEILEAVDATVRQVGEIASAAQDMSARGREVSEAMSGIAAVAEQATAAAEEMTASAAGTGDAVQEIASIATESSATVRQVSESAEEMGAQVEEVAVQAQRLAETANNLQEFVARFRLESDPAWDEDAEYVEDAYEPTPRRRAGDWDSPRHRDVYSRAS